jgi:SNF2 family DNA or RNA helicase
MTSDRNPALFVRLFTDDLVCFERGPGVRDADWTDAITWWSATASFGGERASFNVPYARFSRDFEWLRAIWRRHGYTYDLDDSLKNHLAETARERREFDKLSVSVLATSRPIECSDELDRPLTSFQSRNVSQLVQMAHGADFSVPGAGKTMTALVVWRELRNLNRVGPLLVICPRSSFEAWTMEPREVFRSPQNIQVFGGSAIRPRIDILITNYEQLENYDKLSRIVTWVRTNQAMVVLDEAHRVKSGSNSVRWRACREICHVAHRVDLLTGTPMPQSYDDLRNLLGLSWQGLPPSLLTEQRLSELQRGGIYVRTTKDELGLPPTTNPPPIVLPMGDLQQHIYSALRNSYVGPYSLPLRDADQMSRRGRAAMTLTAVATNPGLLLNNLREDAYLGLRWPLQDIKDDSNLMHLIQDYVRHEIPPKYDWVNRFSKSYAESGKKLLVWSTFVGNLKALHKLLEPLNPALIYGSIPREVRENELERFRTSSDCHVLLTNPQTLGEGVSLHRECHTAVYVDRTYNAGLYLQSVDRIHRLGLPPDQETEILLLESANSIDQRIAARLQLKIRRLGNALRDPGLAKVSLPNDDHEFRLDELGDLDSYDAQDLYQHLMEN